MTDKGAITQKIKGKFQQINGDFKSSMGNDLEGSFEKAKGKVNETFADIKMKMDNKNNDDQGQGYTDPEENE